MGKKVVTNEQGVNVLKTTIPWKKVLIWLGVFFILCAVSLGIYFIAKANGQNSKVQVFNIGSEISLDSFSGNVYGATSTSTYTNNGVYTTWNSGGSGTEASPYLISTAQVLAGLALRCATTSYTGTTGKYFKLTTNVDMAGYSLMFGSATSTTYQFQGVQFDGNGCTISNFATNYTSGTTYAGLFPYIVANNLVIKNLTVSDYEISNSNTDTSYLGGLVGYSTKNITISECVVSGKLIGLNSTSSNGTDITVGGLVGYMNGGSLYINDCHVSMDLTTNTYSSGIAISGLILGYTNTYAEIESVFAEGTLTSSSQTTTNIYCGGAIGYLYEHDKTSDKYLLTDCIILPNITFAASNIGPFVGDGDDSTQYLVVSNSFYDKEIYTQGIKDVDSQARTTEQLKLASTYTSYWGDISTLGTESLAWGLFHAINNGYPFVKSVIDWESVTVDSYAGGTGEESNPYQISIPAELYLLQTSVNENLSTYTGVYFVLTDSIDISSYSWTPIGISEDIVFSGNFDGQGFTIRNLQITGQSYYTGLFGVLDNANISNLNITSSATVTDQATGAGILAGYSTNSTIENCSTSGYINKTGTSTNSTYLSGFIGVVHSSEIYDSYTDAEVVDESTNTGAVGVGGVAGYAYGSYFEVFESNANVTVEKTNTFVGGFVGHSINNDYTTINFTTEMDISSNTTYIGGFNGLSTGSYITTILGYSYIDIASSKTSTYASAFVGQSTTTRYYDVTLTAEMTTDADIDYIGGLIGYSINENADIIYVNFTLTQTSNGASIEIGGFVANVNYMDSEDVTIINNFEITGTSYYIGGAFGRANDCSITDSSIQGSITDTNTNELISIGGIIAYSNINVIETTSVYCSIYSSNRYTSTKYYAGMVGQQLTGTTLSIKNSYVLNTIDVSSTSNNTYPIGSIVTSTGTFIIDITDLITSYAYINMSVDFTSYWYTDQIARVYGTGSSATVKDMRDYYTYYNMGFDMNNIWGINDEVNDGLPYLISDKEVNVNLTIVGSYNSGAIYSGSEDEVYYFTGVYNYYLTLEKHSIASLMLDPGEGNAIKNITINGFTYTDGLNQVYLEMSLNLYSNLYIEIEVAPAYTITLVEYGSGTTTMNGIELDEEIGVFSGDSYSILFTPDTDYRISYITADGNVVVQNLDENLSYTYKFTATKDMTIVVYYSQEITIQLYTTYDGLDVGDIAVEGAITSNDSSCSVNEGDAITLTAPDVSEKYPNAVFVGWRGINLAGESTDLLSGDMTFDYTVDINTIAIFAVYSTKLSDFTINYEASVDIQEQYLVEDIYIFGGLINCSTTSGNSTVLSNAYTGRYIVTAKDGIEITVTATSTGGTVTCIKLDDGTWQIDIETSCTSVTLQIDA